MGDGYYKASDIRKDGLLKAKKLREREPVKLKRYVVHVERTVYEHGHVFVDAKNAATAKRIGKMRALSIDAGDANFEVDLSRDRKVTVIGAMETEL